MKSLGAASTGSARTIGQREMITLVRAAISSLAATTVDAFVFGVATAMSSELDFPRLYLVAATLGAAAGAITNFTINRTWVFRSAHSIVSGAWRYLAVSLLTLFTLQGLLFASIEWAHLHAAAAWPIAKGASWLLVSFPLQRIFVFPERPS